MFCFVIVFCCQSAAPLLSVFFFFNDTATTEIYTLSLHDALPISSASNTAGPATRLVGFFSAGRPLRSAPPSRTVRSEEHTSELQSRLHLVCRLLLEKKKKKITNRHLILRLSQSWLAHPTTTYRLV